VLSIIDMKTKTINISRHASAQLYTPDNKQPKELSHCSLVDI